MKTLSLNIRLKRWVIGLTLSLGLIPTCSRCQSYELQRLILDIQKLNELKQVLSDLYKGYKILETGYTTIKDISKGSFHLHEAFLDGLWLVSPTVRKYPAVQRTIENQLDLVSEYRTAKKRYGEDKHLRPDELVYLSGVYDHLIEQSTQNVSQLLVILSPRTLRMSDAERIAAIDGLYDASTRQLVFLRQFNNRTGLLLANRAGAAGDAATLQQLYGLP